MTYLKINEFYYEATGVGNMAKFYLKVVGETVAGTNYKAIVTDEPAPGEVAVSEINFDIEVTASPDSEQTVYLGDLEIGTDKELTVKATKDGATQDEKKNYSEASDQ